LCRNKKAESYERLSDFDYSSLREKAGVRLAVLKNAGRQKTAMVKRAYTANG